ncbi:minor capsid protein [Lacrimispora xylanisolvens]|uniref:minor capsid protein n=1 Tax=Lacrimispora xylanisolvens TaxID=384636 RepID=UPI0024029E22
MSNLSYWEKRKAWEMFRYMEQAELAAEEISRLYLKSSRHISLELDEIFERYQKKHKLSEKEAYRLLNSMKDKTSLDELKAALRSGGSDKTKAEILAELESPAYQARLERLQQLQNQLDLTMQNVYQQEKVKSTGHYVDLANEAYYRSIFDIQQRTGLNFGFNLISPAAVDRVVNSRWSGANYSARVWSNTKALAQDLKEELLLSLVTGRTDRETADIIANKFAAGASQARRLVRTESCNLANQMEMVSYEECGIEYYIYVATLDLRTSSICRSLDGKRFKVSEQQPGINCPPMHPWCRSTTICDIGDEELSQMKRRARDPVSGKTNTVPANMTYEEWYGKNVKGKPEAEFNEKMIRNRSADRRQFERYKEILGEEAPKTLDSFQKVKYADTDEYSILKAQYKGMSYYSKAIEGEPEITNQVKKIAESTGMDSLGLEYRIKTKESFLEKIRKNYDPGGNEYEIKDIIRYTLGADPERLTEKTLLAIEKFGNEGYNTVRIKNTWHPDSSYNGINTFIKSPGGQTFEMQYHTQESFDLKNGELHKLYEKQRKILDDESEEYLELDDKMIELSSRLTFPKNIERVKNK